MRRGTLTVRIAILLALCCAPFAVYSIVSLSSSFVLTRMAIDGGGGSLSSATNRAQVSQAAQADNGITSSTGFRFYAGFFSIPDTDADTSLDDLDNCRLLNNPDQLDTDADGNGNACDADDDNDGLDDTLESTLGTDPLLYDTDGDGVSDLDEVSRDGNPADYQAGVDSDPLNADTDGDGLNDGVDPYPLTLYFGDGDLAPRNAPDGFLNAADLLIARRIVDGQLVANPDDLSHGDVYPPGAPDGVINLQDLLLIQQMILTAP